MVHAMLIDEEVGESTLHIPICAECGEDLDDKHKSMDLVSINQRPYFKVQRKCTNCGEENLYYRDMEFNARYIKGEDMPGRERCEHYW